MRAKTILSLLFLLSLAVVAVVLLRAGPSQVAQQATAVAARPVEAHEVLVAAGPLTHGTLLRAQDVIWKSISEAPGPDVIVRPSAVERAKQPDVEEKLMADVRGAAMREAVAAGEPIQRRYIVKPGDREFLQVVLTPGARAIAIPIPGGGAGIGLLSPGDRVDVILTQTFAGETPLVRRSVSETVTENLRVLAIDPPVPNNPHRSLTLEVTPEQAEHINVAGELGRLSLTMRSGAGGGPSVASTRPAWAGDVSTALQGAAAPPATPVVARPSLEVIRGSSHSEKIPQ